MVEILHEPWSTKMSAEVLRNAFRLRTGEPLTSQQFYDLMDEKPLPVIIGEDSTIPGDTEKASA